MDTYKVAIVLLVTWIGLACSPSSQKLVKYEKNGVSFTYFSSWEVAEDSPIEDHEGARSIDLEGPDDALVTFVLLPSSNEQTLGEFASSVAEARVGVVKDGLSIGPISPAEVSTTASQTTLGRVGGRELSGISQRFSIRLLGQDVPFEAQFFEVSDTRSKAFIMTHVATENATTAGAAFGVTLDSFRFQKPE